jgi:hypothetical protein
MLAETLAGKVVDVAYVKGLNQKLNKDSLLCEVYVVLSVCLAPLFLPSFHSTCIFQNKCTDR